MRTLWENSYGDEINPLPHDQRNEGMIMVTATSSGFEYTVLPPGPETSSCKFDMSESVLTSNIVALIHTHPYSHGDQVSDPRCQDGTGTYNGNNVSNGDKAIVEAIKSSSKLSPVPMYVIDKDKIRIIDPSNPSQYDRTLSRCGY